MSKEFSELLIGSISPWLVTVLLIVIGTILLFYTPKIIRFIVKMPKAVKILLLFILLVATYVRFNEVPSTHRIYYDEDRYLGHAVTFAKFNKTLSVEIADTNKFILGNPDPVARTTVPVINGWSLKFFGYSEENLFNVAKVFSVIQILLIFAASYLLFKDYVVSLFAAFGSSFLPNVVYWSTSINLDMYFVTFSLLVFVSGMLYANKPSLLNKLLLVSSSLTLLFVRFEAFLFLIVTMSAILIIRKRENKKLLTKEDFMLILIALPLIAFRILISISVFGQTWCCGESTPLESFYLPYLFRNFLPNIFDFFKNPEFPFMITILAGIAVFGKKDLRVFILTLWVILYFLLYSSYYAGQFFDYHFSGSYGRFFLMLYPPLLILAGLTIKDFYRLIFKKSKRSQDFVLIAIGLMTVLTLYPTVDNYKKYITTSPYYVVVEETPVKFHEYLEKKILATTPKDSVIIHSLTGYTLLEGRPSIYFAQLFEEPKTIDFISEKLKKGVHVYSVPPYNCYIEQEKCKNLIDKFDVIIEDEEATKSAELGFVRVVFKNASKDKKLDTDN